MRSYYFPTPSRVSGIPFNITWRQHYSGSMEALWLFSEILFSIDINFVCHFQTYFLFKTPIVRFFLDIELCGGVSCNGKACFLAHKECQRPHRKNKQTKPWKKPKPTPTNYQERKRSKDTETEKNISRYKKEIASSLLERSFWMLKSKRWSYVKLFLWNVLHLQHNPFLAVAHFTKIVVIAAFMHLR